MFQKQVNCGYQTRAFCLLSCESGFKLSEPAWSTIEVPAYRSKGHIGLERQDCQALIILSYFHVQLRVDQQGYVICKSYREKWGACRCLSGTCFASYTSRRT